MARWSRRVAKALRNTRVVNGIAQVAVEWMENHIARNEGRGAGGDPEPHAPLKAITSTFWTSRRPRNAEVVGERTRIVLNDRGRPRTIREFQVRSESYRNGGQPLRNTGNLARSLAATGRFTRNQIVLTMRGMKYGLYQDRGFQTKGPNYIPLTRKGVRGHATGANPNTEGLSRGRDYMMAWRGVKVPARPFILPTKKDMITLGRSIFLGLRAVLKGR
jgi:phage gpG-like protein